MANVADGATGTILTAPSPATSGTSLTLNAGEGYRYPEVPFFAIVHPNNTIPAVNIAEKVQVTARGQTTIAAGSNGASLPQATINVADTSSLNTSGSVTILNNAGVPQVIAYTGKTGTTLTGASGGTGVLGAGNAVVGDNFTIVRAIAPYSAQTIVATWRFSNAIFANDLNNASMVRNEVPVGAVNGSNTAFTTASQFQTKSLMVYLNGVRLKSGGEDYTETAGGFTMAYAPVAGDLLLVDYFIGGTINNIGTNSLINDETPTGTVNGVNTAFTAARPYIPGQLEVYINGVKQKRGTHFTETSPTTGGFTMGDAPLTGDDIMINYAFNLNPASNSDTVDGFHANSTPTVSQILPLDSAGKYPASVLTPTMWWEELGRATLLSAANSLTASFAARKYLRILIDARHAGVAMDNWFRVNGDSGNNYNFRWYSNNASASSGVNSPGSTIAATSNTHNRMMTMDVLNVATIEKLFESVVVEAGVAGAANMANRTHIESKWANTVDPITSFTLFNNAGGNMGAGTEIIILGHN